MKKQIAEFYLSGHTAKIRDGIRLCSYERGRKWTKIQEISTGTTERIRTKIFDTLTPREIYPKPKERQS